MSGRVGFLHLFPLEGGGAALFHALTLQVLLGPRALLEEALGSYPDRLDTLPVEFPAQSREEELLRVMRARAAAGSWAMACLFLHYGCSSSCRYCFLREGAGEAMTAEEVGRALLDFSARSLASGREAADVLLFGGEPFLRPDLVRAALDSMPTLPRMNVSISTCGDGVEPSLASRLASAGAFAIVSMDGGPEVQMTARPSGRGDPFDTAAEAFRILRGAGMRVGISMTISEWNIEGIEDSFSRLIDEFEPDDLGLNGWLHPRPGCASAPGQVGWRRLLSAVERCTSVAIERGMYVEQVFRRLRPFATAVPRLKDCTSPGGRLVYVPGGLRGRCDCMSAAGIDLEPLESDPALSSPSIPPSFSPVSREECLSCPCVCLCGGGCRYDALCASGSPSGVHPDRCLFERGFLSWMIGRLDGICGHPGAEGRFLSPSLEQRLALAGPAVAHWRDAAPMPEATSYAELQC